MTRAFVADASVALGWVHPAQATALTGAMLDAIAEGATLEVPALWPLEVANALLVLERRRKLTRDEGRRAWAGCAASRCASTTRWPRSHSRGCRSWPRPTTSPSTTRRTSSSHSDGGSCWAARTARSGRPQGVPESVSGDEPNAGQLHDAPGAGRRPDRRGRRRAILTWPSPGFATGTPAGAVRARPGPAAGWRGRSRSAGGRRPTRRPCWAGA